MEDRKKGLLFGLAAGDKNGGPFQMALLLAESLAEFEQYKAGDCTRKYMLWRYSNGENSWDTGPTIVNVFEHTIRQLRAGKEQGKVLELVGAVEAERLEAIQLESSKLYHTESKGETAGANAAHRCSPLALWNDVDEDVLIAAAKTESKLSHWHSLSQGASVFTVLFSRLLIAGLSFKEAWEKVQTVADADLIAIVKHVKDFDKASSLSPSGFVVHTLKAALHFVSQAKSFSDAVTQSIKFAGAANYCPVLVGAFAGALFGFESFKDDKLITNCKHSAESIQRAHDVINSFC